MIIKLSPFAPLPGSDERLSLSRAGDVLSVNGQAFDFTCSRRAASCRARPLARSCSLVLWREGMAGWN